MTRARRTKSCMDAIDEALITFAHEERPVTARQCFYALVSQGVITKNEAEYSGTVVRRLGVLRKARKLPFTWIADNSRWMRKPITYARLEDALHDTARFYRRQLWNDQDAYVEIWLEKDALAGVLYEVTEDFDVPLMVTRGYPSLTFLHSAAETIKCVEKPTHIYYFGDHDPSGKDIPRHVAKSLREFGCQFEFNLAAVTTEQIATHGLLTRPTKMTDTRAKGWQGGSVEVDAIPPRVLRRMVRELIESHVDPGVLARTRLIERAERDTLKRVAENFIGLGQQGGGEL